MADPTSVLEASNKQYTDNAIASLGLNLEGNKHYRGSTSPINPSPNDTWDEETLSGAWNRTWFWNGTYWLSTQEYTKSSTIISLAATTTMYYDLPLNANIYVLGFNVAFLLGATNNNNAFWGFVFGRSTGTSTSANFASFASSNNAANSWWNLYTPINTHVNIASTGSKAFKVDINRFGTPSNLVGGIEISYRIARP